MPTLKSAVFVSGPVNNASVPGDLYCSVFWLAKMVQCAQENKDLSVPGAVKLET